MFYLAVSVTLFQVVQGLTGFSFIDGLMIASAEYLVFLVPAGLIGLWFYSENGKKDALFSFSGAVLALGVSYLLGMVFSHPAPYSQSFETLLVEAPENSFPSQHTAVMLGAAMPLLWRRIKIGSVLVLTGLLTGFARVYTGLHFPVDILGSLVAVAAAGFCLRYFEERFSALFERITGIEEYLLDIIGFPERFRSVESWRDH